MILIIMFGIIIYAASILRYEFLQEDLIFFSLLSKENYIKNKVDDNNKDIMFEIGNDKTQVQRIDFCNIIKNKTLINQKIAPAAPSWQDRFALTERYADTPVSVVER